MFQIIRQQDWIESQIIKISVRNVPSVSVQNASSKDKTLPTGNGTQVIFVIVRSVVLRVPKTTAVHL